MTVSNHRPATFQINQKATNIKLISYRFSMRGAMVESLECLRLVQKQNWKFLTVHPADKWPDLKVAEEGYIICHILITFYRWHVSMPHFLLCLYIVQVVSFLMIVETLKTISLCKISTH